MANDRFVADPVVLNQEGENQLGQGSEFGKDIQDLYNSVDEIGRIYESSGQQAITNDVYAFKDDLKAMQDMFTKYGEYLKTAAVETDRNEQNIVEGIKYHNDVN